MKRIVDGLPYPIIISGDAAQDVAAAASQRARSAVVICDRRVEGRAVLIAEALRRSEVSVLHIAPIHTGERTKNQRTVNLLYRALLSAGADRRTLVVAVGGGTLSDTVGFAAATFMRGLPWLPVPTTLLAMVDAAIGGKTGIDLPEGKNLIGALWQPLAVVADLFALESLPLAQRRAGIAEIVKAGIIGDRALLESNPAHNVHAAPAAWLEVIESAVRVKLRIVAQDPREQGVRAALNLGHTTAHAIEQASRYRTGHGSAVAIGLRVAGVLARERTGWPLEDHRRVVSALRAAELPLSVTGLALSDVVAAMRNDKKRAGAALNFVLPVRLGELPRAMQIDESAVLNALQECSVEPQDGGW